MSVHITTNNFADTFNRSGGVHYREYLGNKDEPKDAAFYDGASAELEVGLIRSVFYERRKLRRTARRLRYAGEAGGVYD